MPSSYSVGTVTVANGGTTVTGVGTSWAGKVFEGDLFTDPAQGLFARVTADATSNTSLSINAWPGLGLTADPYEVLFQADSIRVSERTRQLLEEMAAIEANGRGLFYRFSNATTDSDPGDGYLRLNHATEASATMLYIDGVDANGSDLLALLDTWDDSTSTNKGKLFLRSIDDASKVAVYNVTALTTATGYRKVTIAFVDGDADFDADEQLMVDFARTGDIATLTALGISAFIQTLVDDVDASAAQTTLGISTFIKTLIDDTSAAAARTTLAALGGALGSTDNALLRADGTGGVTAQGSLAVLTDAGRLTLPDQPAYEFNAAATAVSNYVLPSADLVNRGGHGSGGVFTAPAAGIVHCYANYLAGTSSACRLEVRKNNASATGPTSSTAATTFDPGTLVTQIAVAAGDTLRFYVVAGQTHTDIAYNHFGFSFQG